MISLRLQNESVHRRRFTFAVEHCKQTGSQLPAITNMTSVLRMCGACQPTLIDNCPMSFSDDCSDQVDIYLVSIDSHCASLVVLNICGVVVGDGSCSYKSNQTHLLAVCRVLKSVTLDLSFLKL